MNYSKRNELPKDEKLNILKNEFAIKPTRKIDDEVRYMCNLSEGIERKGIEKGMEKGIEKAMITLVKALKEVGMSKEKITEKVSESYNISSEKAKSLVDEYFK